MTGWWTGSGGYVIGPFRVVLPEEWRSAVIVPLYKDKGESTECKNYGGISFFSIVGKIYVGILLDRVHKVTGGLINNEQGGV